MFTSLIQAIKAVVRTNGRQAITGKNMQGVLLEMVQALGEYPTFAGMATPSTTPTTSDANVFYLAYEAGEYSGFSVTLDGTTYNIIRRTSQGWEIVNTNIKTSKAIAETIASALEGYSTTAQVAQAIASALQPYITKVESAQSIITALEPYAKTSEVATAIIVALQPYATKLEVAQAVEVVNAEIIDDELVAAAALNDLNDRVKALPTKENVSKEIDAKLQAMRESIVAMIDTMRAEIIEDELVAAAAITDLNNNI